MQVRLLGPVDVLVDGVPRPVRGLRRKAMLAVLSLHPGEIVSTDRLLDAVWGDAPPPTALNTVQSHVSQLRQVLGSKAVVRAAPPGYTLDLGPDGTDVEVAERLVRAGTQAADPHDRAGQLRAALGLWRGRPLADLVGLPWLDEQAERLDGLRLQATRLLVETRLALGEYAQLLPELELLAREHPFDEQLHGQLVLALYRAGRQADALASYQRLRRALADDLGIDPSQPLRDLEAAVLRQDPALDPPAPAAARPAPPPSPPPGPAVPVPAQLPPAVPAFTGRSRELAVLSAALDLALAGAAPDDPDGPGRPTGVVISAVSGTPGVGKTALAVHWAHRVADRFPDGQLYVNLRGYDPDQPVTPADALAGLLNGLGVAGQDVPLGLDERAARYRTGIAGRRILVVLDNAATVEQVRPLLPGTPTAMVVVTSRDSLAGLVALQGARRLELDLLPDADALALLRGLVGGRVDAEPAAAARLTELCVRLPLALRVAAELAAARPATPLADLVAELGDQRQRLDLLDAGGDPRAAVTAVFSWSYRHLPADAARGFRLAGLHPGPDVDAYAVAALTGAAPDQSRRTLEVLARAHLIHPTGTGRYGMHDLLRAYATGLAAGEPAEDPRAALSRLFDYYLGAAAAAMDRLYPAEEHRRPRVPPPATAMPGFADPDAARAWLDAERPSLVAVCAHTAAHGWPGHTVALAATLYRYLAGGYYADAVTIHGHARQAAEQVDDPDGEAQALIGLGTVHGQLGEYEQAAEQLQDALALFQKAGDTAGQARALGNLGVLEQRLSRYGAAADHFGQALDLFRETGDRHGEAHALAGLGGVEERLGRYREATAHHRQAHELCRETGDRIGEAWALTSLGDVAQRLGRYPSAVDYHQQALDLYRQTGSRVGEGWALTGLGDAHTRLGRPDEGAAYHHRALALFRESGDRDGEPWALNGLGEAARAAGRPADAQTHHTAALATARSARDRSRAHAGLGHAHRDVGDLPVARDHLRRALALSTELGAPEADQIRADLADLDPPAPGPS